MGDYNTNYFNKRERECLESILKPYGLNVMDKDHATRVQNQSRTLIDYIITDHLKSENFETFVSDSVFRTSKNKSIDHRATSAVSNLQIEKRCNVTIKEVFDKSIYKRDEFCQEIQRSDWCRFYRQKSAEKMFYVFNNILKIAMRKCVFIRNDKNLLTIQKSWVEKESIEIYNKMEQFMHPDDISYKKIQQNFVEKSNENRSAHNFNTFKNLKTEQEKWNFINEARNSKKAKLKSHHSKTFLATSILTKVSLLNYRFSKVDDYLGSKQIP